MNETQILLEQLGAYSYLGVFIIALLANMVVPVPEEIVLIIIGYAIGTGMFSFLPTVALVFLGIFISDSILYYFSKKGTRFFTWIYEKYFGSLGIGNNENFLKQHINKIIFMSRFIMQFRFLGPFLAGHFRVPYKRFVVYESMSLVIYAVAMLWLGVYFRSRIDFLLQGVGEVKNIILIIIGIVIIIALMRYLKKWFVHYLNHPAIEGVKNLFK